MLDRDEDPRTARTHDPAATPHGTRRGYVRTMTIAMIVLVVLVIVWWVAAQVLFV
jgi:hypothetical protein